MRQFLAVAILGATLAVTASAAFADERGNDRLTQVSNGGNAALVAPKTAPIQAMAREFSLPTRTIADHERQ